MSAVRSYHATFFFYFYRHDVDMNLSEEIIGGTIFFVFVFWISFFNLAATREGKCEAEEQGGNERKR